ncbi:Rop family plasmid primer RNA-binding protein, partial [Shigella flexneri]|nr:Rop family plasmid primer RNA-binding protein [Shigella flexneri]
MGVMIPMKRERMLTIRVTDDEHARLLERCEGNRACSSSVTRIVSILSRFIGIITPMNRNPPYTEASVTKQEKTALNMARF